MNAETAGQLRDLAAGDSYAAFKSAALAVGLTAGEAEQFYQDETDGEVEEDVRDSGMELRSEQGWLMSTAVARVER